MNKISGYYLCKSIGSGTSVGDPKKPYIPADLVKDVSWTGASNGEMFLTFISTDIEKHNILQKDKSNSIKFIGYKDDENNILNTASIEKIDKDFKTALSKNSSYKMKEIVDIVGKEFNDVFDVNKFKTE